MSVKFDHYFTSSEETQILHELERKYPKLIKVYSICKTPGGRDIWATEITNCETGPIEAKPAFHLDGSTHASELTGSMSVMYFINFVLENYGKRADVTKLLDDCGVYTVPCISPDGMDTVLLTDQKPRSADRPFPKGDLQPGLHAKDMDGDGAVRLMRLKSPYGAWKISSEDPALMVRRQPDDNGGVYYNLYNEGEYVGEYDDAEILIARHPWDYDFNRNFPVAWVGDALQSGAGEYPLCNPETKAMADFILARRNISAAVTGHTCGGVFFYPPGPIDEAEADAFDMNLYHAMADIGAEETGYTACNLNRFDKRISQKLYGHVKYSHGAFDDWMYVEQGILATTIEYWNVINAAGLGNDMYSYDGPKFITMDEGVAQWNRVMKWLEQNADEGTVKPWTKFDHPQLGEVEIGGIDPRFCTANPPPKMLEKELEAASRYILRYALSIPKLVITNACAKAEADGIYRVTATIANRGYLPTYGTRRSLFMQNAEEVEVRFDGEAALLEGAPSAKIGHLEGFSAILTQPMSGARITAVEHKPCVRVVSYLVRGKPGDCMTVTAAAPKAGTATATVIL